jgi:RNA polymerase sigma-70 factor (ECF subfamily)
VAAVAGGDRDAFRELIELESSDVVRICHRVLGDLHDAEDAAQEAFVTAYRALGTWRGDGPFGAWLSRIAVRVALRHAGRRSRARQLAWIDPPATGTSGAANGQVVTPYATARADDPAHLVLRWERSTQVRSAVANLEEPYREVVALRFFGGLSLAEISTTCGRPIGTVKTHLHRGLLRLRSTLEDES